MPSRNTHILILIIASLAWTACADNSGSSVPKPKAYHRISVPDSVYSCMVFDRVAILLNSSAVASDSIRPDGTWIDIAYPHFDGAKLYLTITSTSPSKLPSLIGNRTERIRLDTSSATTEITQLTSIGGWEGALFVTRSSTGTPIHILAHNAKGNKLLSGALYINTKESATPDSISPIVSAVARDLIVALKNLKEK